jgi:Arc/MetJ-type ribon-helix-helix transcriptional regulator
MQKRIIFRLPDELFEKIDGLIKKGKFKSLSQVMREALKQFLEKQDGEAKA